MALSLLLASLLGACGVGAPLGSAGGTASTDANASRPSLSAPLVVAVPADFPTLDPAQANDTESVEAVRLLYEPLFTYLPDVPKLAGLLADHWSWSADGRRLTIYLRPTARFADGSAVTAADVVYTFERLLGAASTLPQVNSFSGLMGFDAYRGGAVATLAGVQARGPRVVEFDLHQRQAFFLDLLTLPSTGVVKAGSPDTGQPIGSGPYVISRRVRGQELDLTPNPNYWRRGVRIDGVQEGPFAPLTFRVVADATRQIDLFAEGYVDMIWPLASSQVTALGRTGLGSALWMAPAPSLFYLGFNVAAPPLDDARVRRAIALAINRPALVAAVNGMGSPADGFLPPGIGASLASPAGLSYDPTAARQLLTQAGAIGASIPLSVVAGPDEAIAAAVRDQLALVGLHVDIRPESWSAFYADRIAGRDVAYQDSWVADYLDPQDFVFNLWGGAGGSKRDPRVIALEADADTQPNPERRLGLYRQIESLLLADPPAVPEFFGVNAALVQPWVCPRRQTLVVHELLTPQLDKLWSVKPANPPTNAGGSAPQYVCGEVVPKPAVGGDGAPN